MHNDTSPVRSAGYFKLSGRIAALLASILCASCAITEPVVVVNQNGGVFRGTTTAALTGGSFGVTNGLITCSGTYNDWDVSLTITIPAKCSDGRTGIIKATREVDGVSGMGTIAVSDGSTWTFGFGSDAAKVEEFAHARASRRDRTATIRKAPTVSEISGSTRPSVEAASSHYVQMVRRGGTYTVPVTINGAIKLSFVVDSGAADVSVPADVVLTLIRTGTITDADFLGSRNYQLADGSTLPSTVFRIRSLAVGDELVSNVTASVAPVRGTLLLGQSFLGRFDAWSVDNKRHRLLLAGSPTPR